MFKANKWAYLILLSIIWGSSFILIKKSLIGISPIHLGALRIIFTALFLFIVGFKSITTIPARIWKWVILSGVLGTLFPAFMFSFAQTEIDSGITSILNSLTPLNTVLLGLAIFKITTTRRQVMGVVIGLLGTVLLIISGASLNPDQNYLYAGLIIISTAMYAANVNIIKKYLQDISPIAIAAGNFLAIIVPAFIVLLFSDFFSQDVFQAPNFQTSIVYLVILALFGTAMAKVLFNKLVQISTPVFASSVTYLMPIVAVAWGLWDGEGFSMWQVLATLIVLLGVYLSNSRKPQ